MITYTEALFHPLVTNLVHERATLQGKVSHQAQQIQDLEERLSAAKEELRLMELYFLDTPPSAAKKKYLENGYETATFDKGGFVDRYFELERAKGQPWPTEFEDWIKRNY